MTTINQKLFLIDSSVSIAVKREDLIHPYISGNKYRKLKYTLEDAQKLGHKQLLTFGGAYSNHIAAVAYAGKIHGFGTIGVIRGEELMGSIANNPTLKRAQDDGMEFVFVTREQYRLKEDTFFLSELANQFGIFYVIPEGGTSALAVKGCEEILTKEDAMYDYICCAVGTGGTISGIINSVLPHQKVLGFPALKGDFLSNDIRKFAKSTQWELHTDYTLGGYAKVTPELINFINSFFQETKIPLDPVYTGKMVFGVMDLLKKNYFQEGSKVLLIHTGGLQGVTGMNQLLAQKNWPLIECYD
jgi:1-aminocyclopropane-1-carboxylate deaminase